MNEQDSDSGSEKGDHYFALTKGTKLFEFEIESVLGHGGFGITYKATDTLLQETVAIKEFLPNDLAIRVSDATVRAKSGVAQNDFQAGLRAFLDEARLIARIRHPNVIQVRRFFELHGTGYIVLTYEEGQTLGKRLNARPLSEAELRTLLFGLLDGLEAIHERAILHRDLKPSNVILRPDGAPVLIDFGAARDFKGRHSYSVTAIAAPGYSPPEQYGVGGRQGPWTDLYALGAIAYRCVTGETPADSLRRLRTDPLVPATKAAAGKYDVGILRAIDWMMTIDEAERPASVRELRAALQGGEAPVAPDTTSARAPSRESPRGQRTQPTIPPAEGRSKRPVALASAAVLLLLLLGAGGMAVTRPNDIGALICTRLGLPCAQPQLDNIPKSTADVRTPPASTPDPAPQAPMSAATRSTVNSSPALPVPEVTPSITLPPPPADAAPATTEAAIQPAPNVVAVKPSAPGEPLSTPSNEMVSPRENDAAIDQPDKDRTATIQPNQRSEPPPTLAPAAKPQDSNVSIRCGEGSKLNPDGSCQKPDVRTRAVAKRHAPGHAPTDEVGKPAQPPPSAGPPGGMDRVTCGRLGCRNWTMGPRVTTGGQTTCGPRGCQQVPKGCIAVRGAGGGGMGGKIFCP